jgi:hypothetical protein
MNKYQTAIVDHEGLIYVLEAITNLKREYTKNEVYSLMTSKMLIQPIVMRSALKMRK